MLVSTDVRNIYDRLIYIIIIYVRWDIGECYYDINGYKTSKLVEYVYCTLKCISNPGYLCKPRVATTMP